MLKKLKLRLAGALMLVTAPSLFAHGGHGIPERVPHLHADAIFVLIALAAIAGGFAFRKFRKES